jgi:hypothetical protein
MTHTTAFTTAMLQPIFNCCNMMCDCCAGDVKMTHTTAFTTAMLAWGILSFPKGYSQAKELNYAMDGVKWGADYLMKTFRLDPNAKKPGSLIIVYQVCPCFPPGLVD